MSIEVTDAEFEEKVLNETMPVMVDFWAPWCGPCRMVGPVIDELGKDFEGKAKVVKLNIQDNQQVASKFGIRNIPTVVLFSGGKVIGSIIGARAKKDYAALLEKAL
jgi:thioredoxin